MTNCKGELSVHLFIYTTAGRNPNAGGPQEAPATTPCTEGNTTSAAAGGGRAPEQGGRPRVVIDGRGGVHDAVQLAGASAWDSVRATATAQ